MYSICIVRIIDEIQIYENDWKEKKNTERVFIQR